MSEDRTPLVLPFRALVSAAAWDRLTANRLQTYLPGAALLTQGAPGTHVLALDSGLVKVVRVDRDGRRRLLAFRGEGEILGEMAVQSGGTRTASVWAMSMCKAAVVLAEEFRRLVQNPELAGRLAVMTSHRLWEQTEIHDGAVHERLALTLLRLVDSSDQRDPAGRRTRTFSLTRDDLAQHLNVGRKAVSKALEELGADTVEAAKCRITVVNEDHLRRLVRERDSA
jgi:CRP-like cAMP-binding protein